MVFYVYLWPWFLFLLCGSYFVGFVDFSSGDGLWSSLLTFLRLLIVGGPIELFFLLNYLERLCYIAVARSICLWYWIYSPIQLGLSFCFFCLLFGGFAPCFSYWYWYWQLRQCQLELLFCYFPTQLGCSIFSSFFSSAGYGFTLIFFGSNTTWCFFAGIGSIPGSFFFFFIFALVAQHTS